MFVPSSRILKPDLDNSFAQARNVCNPENEYSCQKWIMQFDNGLYLHHAHNFELTGMKISTFLGLDRLDYSRVGNLPETKKLIYMFFFLFFVLSLFYLYHLCN